MNPRAYGTVFVGSGFVAKYPEGGGNFGIALQWMLGLRRLGLDAVWLEWMPSAKESPARDASNIRIFQRRMQQFGFAGRYCLLHAPGVPDTHDLDAVRCIGLSRAELDARLAGPTTLLNLSYSIHPPLLLRFERRVFCDLDPGEIGYWMTRLEMGQSSHTEFWTIGLNTNSTGCRRPATPGIRWRTFPPLIDTRLVCPLPPPGRPKVTTIGQWYWDGVIEVDGEYPDLSKRNGFEPYLPLARRIPGIRWELAMNMPPDDPDRARLAGLGWHLADPHRVAGTPARYYRYLASASAEFTVAKGVDTLWRTGWISDRAIGFLATGRPVLTQDTGAIPYLPERCGFLWFNDPAEAEEQARRLLIEGPQLGREARRCAVEVFDAAKVIRRILES